MILKGDFNNINKIKFIPIIIITVLPKHIFKLLEMEEVILTFKKVLMA